MTILRDKRCNHCGEFYTYMVSGYASEPTNDEKLCPNCKEKVNEALRSIPRKLECRRRNISELPSFSDVTLDQVLRWEREYFDDAEKRGKLAIQRVGVGLFKLDGSGDSQSVRMITARDGKHAGTNFWLSTWKIDPEYSIHVDMEFDLLKNNWTGHIW